MIQPIPESYNFTFIPVPMPPMLPKALSFPEGFRYIKLTYEATNCYVDCGRGGHTDNFWIYSALVDHKALRYYLDECDLGSDDTFPTHALLIDTETSKLYLGEYNLVAKFLKDYLEFIEPTSPMEMTPEDKAQLFEAIRKAFEQHEAKTNAMSPDEFSNIIQQRLNESYEYINQITNFLNDYLAKLIQTN